MAKLTFEQLEGYIGKARYLNILDLVLGREKLTRETILRKAIKNLHNLKRIYKENPEMLSLLTETENELKKIKKSTSNKNPEYSENKMISNEISILAYISQHKYIQGEAAEIVRILMERQLFKQYGILFNDREPYMLNEKGEKQELDFAKLGLDASIYMKTYYQEGARQSLKNAINAVSKQRLAKEIEVKQEADEGDKNENTYYPEQGWQAAKLPTSSPKEI